MVEAKLELNGLVEAETQGALLKTLRFYHQALHGVTCETHGSKPSLKVTGDGTARLAVTVEACCPTLTRAADTQLRAVSRRDDDM
jgi:hypothetical protein